MGIRFTAFRAPLSHPGRNTERMDLKLKSASRQVLRTVVMELGRRAGIHAHLTPHWMRHAFGDHLARHAGIKNAQALLGHADVARPRCTPARRRSTGRQRRSRATVRGWNEHTFHPTRRFR